MDNYSLLLNDEPVSVHLNIDKFYGRGIKDFKITIDQKTFIFSKAEIKIFLEYINKVIPKED